MTTIELQVPDEMTARFDQLAQYAGQPREQVMLDILAAYLEELAAEDARVDEALAQVERGEVVDADEVFAEAEATLLARGITPDFVAAVRAEAEQEADAFYGVSACE
jgi:predicted transcriptional regulator